MLAERVEPGNNVLVKTRATATEQFMAMQKKGYYIC